MLRDPENVKKNAAATVARYHERLQAEQQARDQVCKSVKRKNVGVVRPVAE
jgi:hypothetical protein